MDHAVDRLVERYRPDLKNNRDAARQLIEDHFFRSDARMLDELSAQGDRQYLLPELGCVAVFKPDNRPGYEKDWAIPTILSNPERRLNRSLGDQLAPLAKIRDSLPIQTALHLGQDPPKVPAAAPPAAPKVPAAAPAKTADLAGPLRELHARLLGRVTSLRAAVAGAPQTINLTAWADRQMTVAEVLTEVADELEDVLELV